MAQRRGSNKWDITLDGNKFKILKGEDEEGYTHTWQHISVNEQERFSPETRGHMVSRPDLRSFLQTDWSGGQTWFKPTLPNQDGRTYFQASLFDTYSKPGNLVPLNDLAQSTTTEIDDDAHGFIRSINAAPLAIGDTTLTNAGNRDVYVWVPANDDWVRTASFFTAPTNDEYVHGVVYNNDDGLAHVISGDTIGTASGGNYGTFDADATAESPAIITTLTFAPGSSIFLFDGKVMWYNGDTVAHNVGGTATTITDDNLGFDMLNTSNLFLDTSSNPLVPTGSINLATATDRGVMYVKNVRQPSGQPQARIFRVEVTDAGTYIREPLGSLPEGLMALNVRYHMDSLLIIATPDWSLLGDNDRTAQFFRSQLWHYTQGSIGAVGTFDGETDPAESPLFFPKADGATQFISSDQRMWAFDAVRGGIHQVFDYTTAFTSGFVTALQTDNSSGEELDLYLGNDTTLVVKKPWTADPKTGAWAAKSYTLVSNYFNFGIELETKQLQSVTALFEAGSANETYIIEVQNDDDGTWTQVASMTCDNGGVPITTDLTGNNITGNRFQYRIKLQVDSGTNMPEFRAVEFKAISGQTIETWDLVFDGTEIVNVENEKQDPNVVYDNLKATGIKNVLVAMTDHYESSDADASAVDVRVDMIRQIKGDSHEAKWMVRLVKVDV